MMVTNLIQNPVLRGFNPDPCICRAGELYYIAVSSFEWLPGVRVYASADLVNWKHETDLLTHQAELRGNPRGGSIWAPMLSYCDGLFYCIYTDVKSSKRPFKDTHNYMMTAPDIHGPWSAPVYINSSGFDPSLFHDADGRKWFLNELWDYRMTTPNKSCGIVMQEYDPAQKKLVGERYKIFDGTALAKTEAPHLYRKNGYYYLVTAEGGTGSGHSVTVCRSKSITGPYEVDPKGPMLTASDKPASPLQCAGHMSLVQTPQGRWYGAYLCTRPLEGKYAILGRETAIQEIEWAPDGWPRLAQGGNGPAVAARVAGERPVAQTKDTNFHDHFDGGALAPEWNTLRIPAGESWCSLKARQGYLRLTAGESPQSLFEHHLLAVRQKDFCFTAGTRMAFEPDSFMQMAGMMLYLNDACYLYAYVSRDEAAGKCLRLMRCVNDEPEVFDCLIPLPAGEVELRFSADGASGGFDYRTDGDWMPLGDRQDLTFLSGGFTGNFIGVAVHDMERMGGCWADFAWFDYRGLDALNG